MWHLQAPDGYWSTSKWLMIVIVNMKDSRAVSRCNLKLLRRNRAGLLTHLGGRYLSYVTDHWMNPLWQSKPIMQMITIQTFSAQSIFYPFNPLSAGGEHSMLPLSKISSCALGTDFLVAPNGWQFLSMNIFEGYFPSRARNCLGRVLELSFWARGHFKVSKSECNLYFWSYNVMWLVKIGDLRDARYI